MILTANDDRWMLFKGDQGPRILYRVLVYIRGFHRSTELRRNFKQRNFLVTRRFIAALIHGSPEGMTYGGEMAIEKWRPSWG